MSDLIVGIDLGTTNSEIAAYVDGRVRILGPQDNKMLPSCVGISPNGELLVGESARHQQLIYPDRTVRSVKRKMGSMESVSLGEKTFTPQEISALVLRELAEWARRELGQPVKRAVITVPAYFSDTQRNATREASLAYGFGDGVRRTVMIYDLGGGTFDVSIVTVEGDVTEVLASHGNNRLGGDDFDDLLVQHLEREFHKQHGIWLRENLGERGGVPYPYCYHPIIRRNTPLPVTRTESYATTHPYQTSVEIQIFQGDDEDALKNILVGDFRIDNLTPTRDLNEVMCRMSLDLDGILHVTAIEKCTGKSKHITIANANQTKSQAEIAAARKRIEDLYASRSSDIEDVPLKGESEEFLDAEAGFGTEVDIDDEEIGEEESAEAEHQHTNGASVAVDAKWSETRREAVETLQRSRKALSSMHQEDQEEARSLHKKIETAVASHDGHALNEAVKTLKELLFFVEGN